MKEARTNLYIFMGPPGSGKGSLSQLCVKKLGWMQLSTGFLCRKHIAEGTKIGHEIDFSIKSGKLINDKLIEAMVEEWLLTCALRHDAIILDGFPRTLAQAESLNNLLAQKFPHCSLKVIRLTISDQEVVHRLTNRYVCANKECQAIYSSNESSLAPQKAYTCDRCLGQLIRRSDDNVDTVENRLKTYQHYEKDLINFFKLKKHAVVMMNVEKSLNAVFNDFLSLINTHYDNN